MSAGAVTDAAGPATIPPSPGPVARPAPAGPGPRAEQDRLTRRIGFELELLAPPGLSRADLAAEVARRHGGRVRRFWHADSEPSLVPGMDHFIHLTPGFEVLDAAGGPLCRLVDDITLRQDLDPGRPARPGWYRLLGDEPRLVRLVHRHADPDATIDEVLEPVAAIFGVDVAEGDGIHRVDDDSGATVVMAAPIIGERERACEVITPPLTHDHGDRLEQLLGPARDLGFTVPAEAAVHLHVDAGPLRQVGTFANLVRLFAHWREQLREAFGTNPLCRRLGPPPQAVLDLVAGPLPARWADLTSAIGALGPTEAGLTKYQDVNLTSLVTPLPGKDTVEIRCLPGMTDSTEVLRAALLVERLLDRCQDPRPIPPPDGDDRLDTLLGRPAVVR